jgi:hypothetical protein
MKVHNYKGFRNESKHEVLEPINENLDRAKKLIKERETIKIAAKELNLLSDDLKYKMEEGDIITLRLEDFPRESRGDLAYKMKGVKMKPDELKQLEKSPTFKELREIVGQKNLGFMYNFAYMFYIEKAPLEDLRDLSDKLKEYKSLLPRLSKMPEIGRNFDANFIDDTYIDNSTPDTERPLTNFETITDAMTELGKYKKVKIVLDSLPKKMRDQYDTAPKLLKNDMDEIARGFLETVSDDEKVRAKVWRNFFGGMIEDTYRTTTDGDINPTFGKMVYSSRIKKFEKEPNPLKAFIIDAKKHLKTSVVNIDERESRLRIIEKTNDRFGQMGCELILDDSGIIIVIVFSFPANNMLNAHAGDHCIVSAQHHWNHYVGEFNKQYYIYNTNISKVENLSTIGVSIEPDQGISSAACQDVQNNPIRNRFRAILNSWENEYDLDYKLFDMLQPMSEEEVDKRKRAKEADREIIKKGLSMDDIKRLVTEDGADINKNSSQALINATEDGDYEKIKLCLEYGASPNLASGSNAAISKAKDFDTVKLLVSYGSDLTTNVLKGIINNPEALQYCFDAGLDPNMSNSRPLRECIKGTWKSKENLGDAYVESAKVILDQPEVIENVKRTIDIMIKYAVNYGRIGILELMKRKGLFTKLTNEQVETYEKWLEQGGRITPELADEVLEYISKNMYE